MELVTLIIKKYKAFNIWLAKNITTGIGTMTAAYLFLILDLIELPPVIASHSLIIIISYITQTVLQLVLLPIIMVGQNIQNSNHSKLSQSVEKLHKKHDELHSKIDKLIR